MKSPYFGNIGYYLPVNGNIGYYLPVNKKCMDDLYFIFSCTSPETLQEFQQPYYTSHLDDAYRDIKLNKEFLNK